MTNENKKEIAELEFLSSKNDTMIGLYYQSLVVTTDKRETEQLNAFLKAAVEHNQSIRSRIVELYSNQS